VIFFEHISSEATKDFDHPIHFIFENHVLWAWSEAPALPGIVPALPNNFK
jgi:hypothetical protein